MQPIYYSISEKICLDNLFSMANMGDEIQGYGMDCNDATLSEIEYTLTTIQSETKTEETFAQVTFIIAIITLFIVVNLAFLQVVRWVLNY